jgi:hypothetical protein
MNPTDALERLRSVNPVEDPDRILPDEIGAFISEFEHRQANLVEQENTRVEPASGKGSGPTRRTRLRPLVVVSSTAALTILVVGVIGIATSLTGGDSEVIDSPTTVTTLPATTVVTTGSATTLPGAATYDQEPTPTTSAPTTSTTMVVELEEPASAAEIRQFLSDHDVALHNPGTIPWTNLAVGAVAPRLDGEIILGQLGDDPELGSGWDDLGGKPSLVLLWEAWDGWIEYLEDRPDSPILNLSAFQETYDTLAEELNIVSVIGQDDAQIAVDVMAHEGHTFPVLATTGSIPWTWPEGFAWVLLDEEGRYVDMFFAMGAFRSGTAAWAMPHVNHLLEKLEDVPSVGVPLPDATTETGLATNCVESFAVDTVGNLWALSPCGISRFDGEAWEAIEVEPAFYEGADSLTLEMAASPDGSMWFIAAHGGVPSRTVQYADGEWKFFPGERSFQSITVASDGTPWVAKQDQAVRLEGDSWMVMAESDEGTADVASVAAGPDGSIWISREARLDRYDGTTWVSFDNGVSGPGEPGHLPAGPSPWIKVGPGGDVWLADLGTGGLLRFDGEVFTSYWFADQPGPVAFAPNGTVWTVSDGGPFRFDGQTWTSVPVAGVLDPFFTSVQVTPDGGVWFGTTDRGIYQYKG